MDMNHHNMTKLTGDAKGKKQKNELTTLTTIILDIGLSDYWLLLFYDHSMTFESERYFWILSMNLCLFFFSLLLLLFFFDLPPWCSFRFESMTASVFTESKGISLTRLASWKDDWNGRNSNVTGCKREKSNNAFNSSKVLFEGNNS